MTSPEDTVPGGGFECAVYRDLNDALEHTQSLAGSMRNIRKSMKSCAFCDRFDRCPMIHNFRLAIDIALEEITREWDLKG